MKTTKYVCSVCNHIFNEPKSFKDYDGCPNCGGSFTIKKDTVMTKEELKQYIMLKKETERMIDRLNDLLLKGKEDAELVELIENNKLRCRTLLLKTEQFIFNIEDSLLRQIFEARYIKGLTWGGVATYIGGYHSKDYVRIMHDRYLKREMLLK